MSMPATQLGTYIDSDLHLIILIVRCLHGHSVMYHVLYVWFRRVHLGFPQAHPRRVHVELVRGHGAALLGRQQGHAAPCPRGGGDGARVGGEGAPAAFELDDDEAVGEKSADERVLAGEEHVRVANDFVFEDEKEAQDKKWSVL